MCFVWFVQRRDASRLIFKYYFKKMSIRNVCLVYPETRGIASLRMLRQYYRNLSFSQLSGLFRMYFEIRWYSSKSRII